MHPLAGKVHSVISHRYFQNAMHVLHARRKFLAFELILMGLIDQRARRAARRVLARHGNLVPVDHPDARCVERIMSVNRFNAARMKRILNRVGWPRRCEVGQRAASAAWLIAQHADHDHVFQYECLRHLRLAVQEGEASTRDLAYLTDKVLVAEGRRQVYGTQVFDTRQMDILYRLSGAELEDAMARITSSASRTMPLQPLPIEDAERVDHRRAEVGLPPLRAYIIHINRKAGQVKRIEPELLR